MKLMRILAATATACLLTASLAAACDGHEKASPTGAQLTSGGSDSATATPVAGGCAKAKATNASGGCAKAKATNASGGCAKAKATMASGGCAAKAKAGCCAKGEPVMASVADTTDTASCKFKAGAVAFKGIVLCNHCDLKKTETCATMFKTESGCLFALSGDKASELREQAGGGSKLVRIKGEVSETGALDVTSFRVVKSLDTGASAM